MASEERPPGGRFGRRIWAFLAATLLALSCQGATEEPTGGETHFLTRCDADTSVCGSNLACLCGVCTRPCGERGECSGFPVAECVANDSRCGEPSTQGRCDVFCASDSDCAPLSSEHRCEQGVCRAGLPASSGGAGGSGGVSGGAGGAAGACAHGQVPANQLLLIGDSFFASGHQITAYLEDLARNAGALSAGERYRDNSRLVANALALAGNGIADQYDAGVADADVDVVIMNGGGADVLLGSCDTPDASCPAIANAVAAATMLFARMAENGVLDVVYVFYPDPVDSSVRARMDALRPLLQSACASSPVPCHWLDLRPIFAGHYNEYISTDGLNPTAAGSNASAAAIWSVLQQQCIAQ